MRAPCVERFAWGTERFSGGQDAHNCCGQLTRGVAILGDKIFLATLSAGAMTFSVDGKQYISVQAGSSLFTFGLR
jgi:hypothetical protein